MMSNVMRISHSRASPLSVLEPVTLFMFIVYMLYYL